MKCNCGKDLDADIAALLKMDALYGGLKMDALYGGGRGFLFCAGCARGYVTEHGVLRLLRVEDTYGMTAQELQGLMTTKYRVVEAILKSRGEDALGSYGRACPDSEPTEAWAHMYLDSYVCGTAFNIGQQADAATQSSFLKSVQENPDSVVFRMLRILGEAQYQEGSSLIAAFRNLQNVLAANGVQAMLDAEEGLRPTAGSPEHHPRWRAAGANGPSSPPAGDGGSIE